MNRWLLAAGTLAAIAAAIHVFVGGPAVYHPLLASSLDPTAKAVWSSVWHGVSVALVANAVAMLLAARGGAAARGAAILATAIAFGFAATFLGYGMVRLGSPAATPQWTIFLAIAVLATIGLRRPA